MSEQWSLYPYDPVKSLPVLFGVIIFILALLHAYNSFSRPRWPHFGFIMTWASAVWVTGFITRAISIWTPSLRQNVPLYIAQTVLILIGPPLFAASEYFILGRLLAYLPYYTPIHPGRVLTTFLLLSAAVESLTAAGAAITSQTDVTIAQQHSGYALVNAALILQAVVEVCFFSLVALLHHRARNGGHLVSKVRNLCFILYITSAMMLVRCIFRAVQGFEASSCPADQPSCSSIQTNEWYLWVFEVANITLFVAILAVFPPRRFLPNSHKVFMDPHDPQVDRVGPGFDKADNRPFLVTFLDPFNFAGAASRKGQKIDRFWEHNYPPTTETASNVKKTTDASGRV